MEIDFLGLNSPNYKLEPQNSKIPYIDTAGGVEVSLSLSTTSSLNFSEEKTEQPSLLLVAPPVFRHSSVGFLYDLNDAATINLRGMSQLSADRPPSLTMLYPTCPNVFIQPQKAENNLYIPGNASTPGYSPTVAMARRATLARFLEKRLHRMNQARATHLMGISLSATNSEAGETTITRNNKIRNNNLKRRS